MKKFNLKPIILENIKCQNSGHRCLIMCFQYREWRKAVFQRDKYTCQKCKKMSGNGKRFILHPHHIVSFGKIYQTIKFLANKQKKDIYKMALKFKPLWDINNGITLCKECHYKTDNYGINTKNMRSGGLLKHGISQC